MSVDLTDLKLVQMTPIPIEAGGRQVSPLNGATDWIDRLGNRWSFQCETPPMMLEPEGRQWAARVTRARREGAVLRIAQPGSRPSMSPNAKVAMPTGAGRLVTIKDAQPGEEILEGRWVSFVTGGKRYADQIAEQAIVAEDGTATLTLQNLIRAPLAVDDAVELDAKVEGSILEPVSWPVDMEEKVVLSFVVAEDA